ncbi:LuxR family transcriptional regulator [uncultured Adlercreutzia sp.]|uniref:LuxR family transcriptional regulator n=1 Tax=uncultured Adlercreutzia sp. TaxID=875803 RepID=UPI0025E5C7F9|nr:LuxR family transcriptional regulator [uncultured Adlercreutzia sp.]
MTAREIHFIAGFGLFHGWLIALLTYTGAAPLGIAGSFASAAVMLVGGMAAAAVFFAIGQGKEKRFASLADGLLVLAVCLVLVVYFVPSTLLALLSCLACGFLCGSLHCLFGLASLAFSKDEFAPIIAWTTVVASLVAVGAFFAGDLLPDYVQTLVLVALPLASAVFLRRMQEGSKVTGPAIKGADTSSEKISSRFVRLLAAVFLFGVVCRTCDVFSSARLTGQAVSSVSLFASHIVAAIVLVALLRKGRRPGSLAFFYRLALPCSGAGFVLLALPGHALAATSAGAVLLIGVGFEVINLIAWVLTSYAALVAARPLRYFGLYVIATYAAMLVGRLVNVVVLPYAAGHAAFLGLICVVVLVVVVMVVLPEDQVCLFEESLRLSAEEKAEGDVRRERCVAFAAAFGLTERETEVLELLVRGRTLKVVAERLTISKGTAGTHIANIYRKADVHKQQDLIDRFEQFDGAR